MVTRGLKAGMIVAAVGFLLPAGVSHVVRAQTYCASVAPGQSAVPQPGGSVRCPQTQRVLVSKDFRAGCETDLCTSTVPGTPFKPELYFDSRRFLRGAPKADLLVEVCGQGSTDCPIVGAGRYQRGEDGKLPESAEWQVLSNLPMCFVLRWSDGTESTAFAAKHQLPEKISCKR